MKYLLLPIIFLLTIYIANCQNPIKVYWQINYAYAENREIYDLPRKLFNAVVNNEIASFNYDSSKRIDVKYLNKILKPIAHKCFLNKEEISIALKCGDYSVMSDIKTKYSAEDLNEKSNNGEDIKKYFELVKKSPLDVYCLKLEIQEELSFLDTTKNMQKGFIRYLNIWFSPSLSKPDESKFLCRIRYIDFLKLEWEEKERLEQRAFYINPRNSDLIIYVKDKIYKLSDYNNKPGWNINDTLFKYFSTNIITNK
jgi:hypothetical protein